MVMAFNGKRHMSDLGAIMQEMEWRYLVINSDIDVLFRMSIEQSHEQANAAFLVKPEPFSSNDYNIANLTLKGCVPELAVADWSLNISSRPRLLFRHRLHNTNGISAFALRPS